jgi:outer membrane protein assembly factor BamD (BamD/ComL family)
MSEQSPAQPVRPLDATRLASAALEIGAVVVAIAVLFWAIGQLWAIWSPPPPGTVVPADRGLETLTTLVLLVLGWGFALSLWGIGAVVTRLDAIAREMGNVGAAEAAIDEALAASKSDAVLRVLRDIRDVSLLDENQRSERLRTQTEELKHQLVREVPQLIREHKWAVARQRLREARERYPGVPEWEQLNQQVEAARQQVEAADLMRARRQVDDLANLNAWDRAVEVVRDLVQRHPDSNPADELAQQVVERRRDALAQELQTLMADAQEATNRRQWRRALDLADRVIQRFPKSVEAEALRQQRSTLLENAEIQVRHQMEDQIRSFVQQKKYSDALALARSLIDKYPESPQAAVLNDQLPRLEEKAAEQSGYVST